MLINKSKAFPRCFLFARDILAPAFLGVRSEFVAIFSRLSHASLSLRTDFAKLVQSVVNKNNRDCLVLNLQLTDIFSDELLQLQQVV